MPKEKNFFAFFLLKKSQGSPMPSFAFGDKDYVDELRKEWQSETVDNSEKSVDSEVIPDDIEKEVELDITHESALTEALDASVEFGLAQHQLIEATTVTPLLWKIVLASGQVVKPTTDEAELVEEDEHGSIYGLTQLQHAELVERNETFKLARKGMERLPSATLLSLVATFDTLIVDVLSKMLRLQSDWLEKSDRTVSLSEIAQAKDLEEIIANQVLVEVYQFSRGSHTEQAEYIRKNFGIDIAKDWKRWPDYIEIFERRNLVAHGEMHFNSRYVSICSHAGHKGSEKILGNMIELRSDYLKQSLNILIEFSVLLSFSLFRKFVKEDEEQAFSNLNQAVFKLIKKGHHIVAERLAIYALSLKKVQITEQTRLMLIVNQASAVRHDGRADEAKKILSEQDWSAVSDVFQLAVASVSDDKETFSSMLSAIKSSGSISASSLLTWPCFRFMLEDDAIQPIIEKEFGIETRKNQAVALDSKGTSSKSTASEADEDEETTVH